MNEFEKNMEDIFDIEIAPIEKTTEMITQANSEVSVDAIKIMNTPEVSYTDSYQGSGSGRER
jgi:hypothetical protein